MSKVPGGGCFRFLFTLFCDRILYSQGWPQASNLLLHLIMCCWRPIFVHATQALYLRSYTHGPKVPSLTRVLPPPLKAEI